MLIPMLYVIALLALAGVIANRIAVRRPRPKKRNLAHIARK